MRVSILYLISGSIDTELLNEELAVQHHSLAMPTYCGFVWLPLQAVLIQSCWKRSWQFSSVQQQPPARQHTAAPAWCRCWSSPASKL